MHHSLIWAQYPSHLQVVLICPVILIVSMIQHQCNALFRTAISVFPERTEQLNIARGIKRTDCAIITTKALG